MLDGSRFSSLVWTGNLELLAFDSVPKILLYSCVHAGSGQHFLGLTRTLESAQAALVTPRIYLSHGKEQVEKNQPKKCNFRTFCVTIHGLAGTCVQLAGSGDTPRHPVSLHALTLPDPQLLCHCSLSPTGCKPLPPATPGQQNPLERAVNGPKWAKTAQTPRVQPRPHPAPSPRRGMCFLWNFGTSQGGDAGPELCVARASDVLAAVLKLSLFPPIFV